MEKLGEQGPFQLVEEHINTKLWKLVPWYLVRLGNHNGVAAVQCRCTHGEEGVSCSPGKATHCWGHRTPLGIFPAFGSFQGALWSCGHTEARQNNTTCSASSKRM